MGLSSIFGNDHINNYNKRRWEIVGVKEWKRMEVRIVNVENTVEGGGVG